MAAVAIEQLKAAVADRQAEESARYWSWVGKAAAGEEIDPHALLADLDRLGRDPDKFQSDAEALAERRRLIAVAATRPAAEARLRAAGEAVQVAEKKLEDATRELNAVIRARQADRDQAAADLAAVKSAEKALRDSADPALKAERDGAYARLNGLTAREKVIAEGMERCRSAFARESAEAELAEVRRQKQAAAEHIAWLAEQAVSE